MGRRAILGIFLVGAATLVMVRGSLAQSSGVQFVLDGPITLKDGRAEVQVLNGNATAQQISVTAEGEEAKRLAIEGGGGVQGLGRLTVVVSRLGDPPSDDLSIAILAVSTDGSVARSSVKVPGVATAGPLPSSISSQGSTRWWLPSPLTERLDLEWTSFEDRQLDGSLLDASGFVTSEDGGLSAAKIVDGKLTIEPSNRSGAYSGKLTAGDKTIDLKANAKDGIVWPALLLGFGLAVAYQMERFLARRRPAKHLTLILASLREQTEQFQEDAKRRLAGIGSAPWQMDRIYVVPDKGYLGSTARDIERRFGQALAEFERETYGPNGTAVKDLDIKLQDYIQHARNIVELVADYYRYGSTGQSTVEEQLLHVLHGELIETAAKLAERKTLVNDMKSRLPEAHDLVERCWRLAAYADRKQRPAQAQAAETLAEAIWTTIDLSSAKWRATFDEEYAAIEKAIRTPPVPTTTSPLLENDPGGGSGGQSWYPSGDSYVGSTAPGDDTAVADVPVADIRDQARQEIIRGDRKFALVSGLVVLITGLTVLYFNDDTFGSEGDYMTVLIWGATAQQGINLLRRVWPSRLSQLSAQ